MSQPPANGPLPDPAECGTLVHLDHHRAPGARTTTPGGGPVGETSPETRLAAVVQSLYLARGRTLTDPDTALAFDIALEWVEHVIDGVFAREPEPGADVEELLRHMVQAGRQVPGTLDPGQAKSL